MNISLDKVKNVIELAADEVMPTAMLTKYAQRNDVQIYQSKLDKLVMNGSLEV
ncbi:MULTISPECIES: hypothetical protein [unclassified Bartonella]|uniref:hypothetical protein n=1 Tax=unclassified Bartonella TaxID=2645622 RepID=UPI0035CEFF34